MGIPPAVGAPRDEGEDCEGRGEWRGAGERKNTLNISIQQLDRTQCHGHGYNII